MAIDSVTGVLAATVAQRFYVQGDSKIQIAEDLGLSRYKVARLLAQSVDEGIVKFVIQAPLGIDAELSEQVRLKFGLRQAVVVDVPETQSDPINLRRLIGSAAAGLLSELVTEKDVFGVGWGRTTSAMASALTHLARCPVVQLGGIAGSLSENSLELVRRISEINGGTGYPLFAPLVANDNATAEGLRKQPKVRIAMDHFQSITIAAVAIGSWDPPDSQMREDLPPDEVAELSGKGVTAEVLATLLREDGSVITSLDQRTMALGYKGLRRIPNLILVAGGQTKAKAVRSAFRAGLGNILVTDRSLATSLLQ